jgi:hypothetical protein
MKEGCHAPMFAVGSRIFAFSSCKRFLPTLAPRGHCAIIGEVSLKNSLGVCFHPRSGTNHAFFWGFLEPDL